ncbi:prepilin-type N-terminal cleavage/methylation domain-containing protein, partial [Hydrogenophaga sp.]
MHAARSRRPAQTGFTFLEMAVVLVVGGLLSWA